MLAALLRKLPENWQLRIGHWLIQADLFTSRLWWRIRSHVGRQDDARAFDPATERLDELSFAFDDLSPGSQTYLVSTALRLWEYERKGKKIRRAAVDHRGVWPDPSGSREKTAYHEAGHAVVAFYCGVRFDLVSIAPMDEQLGCVYVDLKEPHPGSLQLAALVGGPLAEARYLGAPDIKAATRSVFEKLLDEQCLGDIIRKMAESSSDYPSNEATVAAIAHVSSLLHQPHCWKAVQALATELLLTTRVGGVRAGRIIMAAGERPK